MSEIISGWKRRLPGEPEGASIDPTDAAVTTTRSADAAYPQRTTIVRTMTEIPEKPCVMCNHWRYDMGQNAYDRAGLVQVPEGEGGFLRPGTRPLFEQHSDAGAYDSREQGLCLKWSKGNSFQLSHRFATCPEWSAKGRFFK